jgi:hypothetical protein
MEFRRDEPEKIDQPDDQHTGRHLQEHPRLALHGARQQQAERRREVEEDQRQADEPPAGLQPVQVPRDLLGQVARPDDQVLGEREVRPQHHEREHQIAEIVEVRGCDDAFERLAAAEPHEHDDEECDGGQPLTAEDEHAVDGREPVRLERHEPVEGRERDRQAVSEEPACAQHLHAPRQTGIPGLVLLERPRVQKVCDRVPDREIDRRANQEERRVEVELFVL